jgi:hypothetical protein
MFSHPFQTSNASLFFFYLTFMKVFKRLLSSSFLDCLEAPLVHWQISLLIFNGKISLISLETIVLMAYLGSWVLVAPIIAFRFLLDSCPFPLEVIGANSLGSLPF